MKQNRKILKWTALAGAILLVVGAVVSGLAFAMTGFQFFKLTMSPEDEKARETITLPFEEGEITDVFFDIDFCGIQIEGEEQQGATLTLPASELVYELAEGTLRVTQKKDSASQRWEWYRLLNISSQPESKAVLSLPTDFPGQIRVKNNFGDLTLEGLSSLSRLSVDMDYGSMGLSDIHVKDGIELTSDFGGIQLQNCETTGSLTVKSRNGEVRATDTSFLNGDFSLSFGSLRIEDTGKNTACQSLATYVENGSTTLKEVTAAEKLECHSEFGEITLQNAASKNLLLRNENGAIRGTISGSQQDYQILVETEFGSSSLSPKLTGHYLLDARTEFGDIALSFSEE